MALTQVQLDVLADRSKLIFAEKDEAKRANEIIQATANYGDDMGSAYQAVMQNLQRYEQLAATDKGIDPATGNFVVAPGAVNVSATTSLNTATGYSRSTAEILVGTPLPAGAGTSLAVGGGASVNDKNKVSGGHLTAQYVGTELVNDPGVPVKVLPIFKPTVMMDADGKTSANVLAGVVTAQNNGLTHTDAAIVGHDGNTTVLHRTAYRVKEPIDVKGLDTSVYVTGTAKVYDPKTGLGVKNINGTVGVFAQQNIGNGNSIYGDVNVTASNMENGVRDVAIGAKVGIVFGKAPEPAKDKIEVSKAPDTYNLDVIKAKEDAVKLAASDKQQPEAEQALKVSTVASNAKPNIATDKVDGHYHSTIAPHAGAAQDPVQAKLEHFYDLPRNEQRAIVNHMTDIYVKHNPGVDHGEAQEKVLHEILNPQRNQEPEYSHG